MPEVRDPALKLFGRTIPLLECRKMAAGGTFSRYRSVSGEDKVEISCLGVNLGFRFVDLG